MTSARSGIDVRRHRDARGRSMAADAWLAGRGALRASALLAWAFY
ncbi:hypothetical protein WME79_30990 [Sorangium sp. So ce726]